MLARGLENLNLMGQRKRATLAGHGRCVVAQLGPVNITIDELGECSRKFGNQ